MSLQLVLLLLGLLVGAVAGLWPFREPMEPTPGDIHRGQPLTAEMIADLQKHKWPTEAFDPSALEVALAIALIAAGITATSLLSVIGRNKPPVDGSE